MLKIYFICYYPIGLPITLILCFYFKLYTKGLWIGFTISLLMVSCCFIYILMTVDYYAQIKQVRLLQKKATRLAGYEEENSISDDEAYEYNPDNPETGGVT